MSVHRSLRLLQLAWLSSSLPSRLPNSLSRNSLISSDCGSKNTSLRPGWRPLFRLESAKLSSALTTWGGNETHRSRFDPSLPMPAVQEYKKKKRWCALRVTYLPHPWPHCRRVPDACGRGYYHVKHLVFVEPVLHPGVRKVPELPMLDRLRQNGAGLQIFQHA